MEECNSEDFFNDICTVNNQYGKIISEYSIITNIINDIQIGILDELIKNVLNDEKNDLIKLINNTLYQITSSFNQNNNDYINISTIKIDECEKILKEQYNISQNESLIIFKIEQYIENLLIPLIEYEIFNPKTKEKLDLIYCVNKNLKIYLNIPIYINESNLMIYDPTSDYYNDICYTYTTDSKTDIILFDRQNEFNNKYYLCPKNCTYNGYNFTNKNVICLCEINEGITLISQFNEEELIFKFSNSKSLTNFNVLKCFKLLFSKNGILKNMGNYIIIFIIIIYIIWIINFYFKEYKFICNQINDILEAKIIENLETN